MNSGAAKKETRRGKLIVISAPSGSGKTTIVNELLRRHPNLMRSISYTTRQPRPGEMNGRDYIFVAPDEFKRKRENGFFLECAEVFGCFYGTPKHFVVEKVSMGRDVMLAIDVQGMRQLKTNIGSEIPMTSIFIMPPSLAVLRKRLAGRNTESEAMIQERLRIAEQEMAERGYYDHNVVNEDLEKAIHEIEEAIE